jgi:hypothetical protein
VPPPPHLHRHRPVATLPPAPSEARDGHPVHPSFHCATAGEPPSTDHGPLHHGLAPLVVHGCWTKSTIFSHWKIIPCQKTPTNFAVSPLPFCEIKPRSMNFQEDPLIFENKSRYSPTHFQKLQIGPCNFFSLYLSNHNSNFCDSCTKILKILHSSISCIHNTCLLYID